MVSLKASYIVKPAENTPMKMMSLSDFDQVAAITHPTVVFFYQSFGDEFQSTVEYLKDSLSKTLIIFYPLAGRLVTVEGGRFELDCNASGAKLLVAETEAKLVDFGDFIPSPAIQALTPKIDYQAPIDELPLLLVQITRLGCGGMSLAVANSHIVADGPSMLHFLTEWANFATGSEKAINLPYLDRTILQDWENATPASSKFDYPGYSPPPYMEGNSDAACERNKKTTTAFLKLSKEQVQKLKNKANECQTSINNNCLSCEGHNHSLLRNHMDDTMARDIRPFSGYEAIAGHMWRCASKSRGHTSEQLTRLSFPMDAKNRLEPPLPQHYFGNTMCRIATSSTSGELISKHLCYASSKIRNAINMATGEYLISSLRHLKSLHDLSVYRNSHNMGTIQGVFHGNPNMIINSWVRLPIHEIDFGWGKPLQMVPIALGCDGKSLILPGYEKDGSVVVTLQMQVPHMEAYKKIFYEDI